MKEPDLRCLEERNSWCDSHGLALPTVPTEDQLGAPGPANTLL